MHTDSKYVSAENVLFRNERDYDACPDMCQDARCGLGVKPMAALLALSISFHCFHVWNYEATMAFKIQKYSV